MWAAINDPHNRGGPPPDPSFEKWFRGRVVGDDHHQHRIPWADIVFAMSELFIGCGGWIRKGGWPEEAAKLKALIALVQAYDRRINQQVKPLPTDPLCTILRRAQLHALTLIAVLVHGQQAEVNRTRREQHEPVRDPKLHSNCDIIPALRFGQVLAPALVGVCHRLGQLDFYEPFDLGLQMKGMKVRSR